MRLFTKDRVQGIDLVFWAALAGAIVLLPWWRNHTLLRDFYDYGLVVAGAGRINLGERPYVDFLTPIQTLHFLLASWTERLGGARYLNLTYANALFIGGTLFVFTALLRRRLGPAHGTLIATAVVTASSAQHTIIWHNALGVAWLAVVTWCAACKTSNTRQRTLQFACVAAALWLGGMTKLTYQIAAIAFAFLFTFRTAWRKEMSWRACATAVAGILVFGVVAPLATELLYTGATWMQWKENVLGLAASRAELLRLIFSPAFFWKTPHDYYAPLFFPFVGAWAVALLVAIGWAAGRERWAKAERRSEVLFLGVAVGGAIVCGCVLLATNFEIAYFAAAASLVLATGVALAFASPETGEPSRLTRGLLAVAALTLLVPAWSSAWMGTRALWGHGPLVRSELVPADDLPGRFGYLKGLRIERALHESLQGFDAYVTDVSNGLAPDTFYFSNSTEWMVRAYPEARHAGLPLWLHAGTTFSEKNVALITHRLASGKIKLVVSLEAWMKWHFGIGEFLRVLFESPQRSGTLISLRRRRDVDELLATPLRFATNTNSNLYSKKIQIHGPPLQTRLRLDGMFVAAAKSHQLDLDFDLRELTGEMMAEFVSPGGGKEVTVIFRVRERETNGERRILVEQRLVLTREHRALAQAFSIPTGGKQLSLEVEIPPGSGVEAGWRSLRTLASGELETVAPAPMNGELKTLSVNEHWADALFSSGREYTPAIVAFGLDGAPNTRDGVPELFTHVPTEVWLRFDRPVRRLTGETGLRDGAWTNPGSLPGANVRVLYYKSGRFEVLWQKELQPLHREADRRPQGFEVILPEPTGWVILEMEPTNPNNIAWGHGWWRNLRFE